MLIRTLFFSGHEKIPYVKEFDGKFEAFSIYLWNFHLISLMVSLSKYTLKLVTLKNCDGPAPLLDFLLISVGFDLSGYKMLNSQQ